MTEASHQMTSNPLPKNGPHKPGTVGRAQGSVQVAILDASNQILPPGAIGEVSIRGPNVTKGYFENPKANVEAFAGVHLPVSDPVAALVVMPCHAHAWWCVRVELFVNVCTMSQPVGLT